VVGTTPTAEEASAAGALTRRTQPPARIEFVAAHPGRLPFGRGRFTHVWIVEALPFVPDVAATFAEARRVLRGGGSLAVQDLVPAAAPVPQALAGLAFGDAASRAGAVAHAGFVDLEVRDVSAQAQEHSHAVLTARAELTRRLRAAAGAATRLRALAAERDAFDDALRGGALRVIHLSARAP
jgi:SAM-dependent methyltransferase